MKVRELIKVLEEFCDLDATLELADGSDITNVCYQRTSKRVSFGGEHDFTPIENLAPEWTYLFTDN